MHSGSARCVDHQAAARAGDRHRCGPGHRRTNPRALRRPRRHCRPQAEVLEKLHGRARQRAGSREGVHAGCEDAGVSSSRALLLTMQVVARPSELRALVASWRRNGERIAFVPTMGNLHAGHGDLVRRASELADRVVVSIFVNPLQFGPNEDFAAYPRTPDDDRRLLESLDAHLLFMPEVDEMYPLGQAATARVVVPDIDSILCGAFRPGHFTGVATIVTKLLNLVQPDVALFGEKDYQQLMIIRRAATDLCMPMEIVGVPTRREADGLAMSSRNRYLSAEQRALAPRIFAELERVRRELEAGAGVLPTA